MKIGRITLSDRASAGVYPDKSGPEIERVVSEFFEDKIEFVRVLLPDDREQLRQALIRLCDEENCALVITTGGTGPSVRDVTPEATRDVLEKELPGFGETMRHYSYERVKTSILSRATAGVRGKSLIVNLPGRPKAIKVCLTLLREAIAEGMDHISGFRPTLKVNEYEVPIAKVVTTIKSLFTKTPLLMAGLCFFLSSCTTTSINPLCTVEEARVDPDLLGMWQSKEGDDKPMAFSVKKAPWMHLEIISEEKDKNSSNSNEDFPKSYDLLPCTLGHDKFFSVRIEGKDEQGHKTQSYVIIRYKISAGKVLRTWMMSQDLPATAIKRGELKGDINEDKASMIKDKSGKDIDVVIKDTPAHLQKFILSSDLDELFNQKSDPIYKLSSK